MSTPTEIKAEAIALLTLGHSCREVERELRCKFPTQRLPTSALSPAGCIARLSSRSSGTKSRAWASFTAELAGE